MVLELKPHGLEVFGFGSELGFFEGVLYLIVGEL
jgi:hypothetical protein